MESAGAAIAEPADSAWATDLAQTGFHGEVIRIHPKQVIGFGVDDSRPPGGRRGAAVRPGTSRR